MADSVEIWKDIVEYEGLYQVSNLGRVKRLTSIVKYKRWGIGEKVIQEKILKPSFNRGLYPLVCCYKNGIRKRISVPLKMIEAFLPNPNGYTQSIRIDSTKNDFTLSNVTWGNASDIRKNGVTNQQINRDKKDLPSFDIVSILYKSGKSSQAIGKEFGFSKRRVLSILRKSNQHIKTKSENSRIHKFDEHFFDKIDSESKAYILGFLYADGYNRDGVGIRMNLAEKDKLHLQKMSDIIGSEKPLRFIPIDIPNRQNQWSLDLNSVYLSQKMKELGMMPKKTLILTFPDWMPDNLLNHFIRGYFDGDGCMSWNNKGGNVTFASTESFCKSLKEIFSFYCNSHSSIYKRKNAYILSLGGRNQIKRVFDFLYKDATLYLERKHDKFISYLNHGVALNLPSLNVSVNV